MGWETGIIHLLEHLETLLHFCIGLLSAKLIYIYNLGARLQILQCSQSLSALEKLGNALQSN